MRAMLITGRQTQRWSIREVALRYGVASAGENLAATSATRARVTTSLKGCSCPVCLNRPRQDHFLDLPQDRRPTPAMTARGLATRIALSRTFEGHPSPHVNGRAPSLSCGSDEYEAEGARS
jgi:hypothetical protein